MSEHETQQSVGAWADAVFGRGDPNSPRQCLRLLEEVVELCLAAGADPGDVIDLVHREVGEEVTPNPQPLDKVKGELADCQVVLHVIAHRLGVDLQAEEDSKMKINRSRRWKPRGDGTGQHIKD